MLDGSYVKLKLFKFEKNLSTQCLSSCTLNNSTIIECKPYYFNHGSGRQQYYILEA